MGYSGYSEPEGDQSSQDTDRLDAIYDDGFNDEMSAEASAREKEWAADKSQEMAEAKQQPSLPEPGDDAEGTRERTPLGTLDPLLPPDEAEGLLAPKPAIGSEVAPKSNQNANDEPVKSPGSVAVNQIALDTNIEKQDIAEQ